ncbi:MAG TPA: DAK2 domain-containing protein [Clostridiaceae bacterium]
MDYLKINGQNFKNMMINASNRLEEQKEFVNALNVFPVPDGDTGTNMSMTLKTAVASISSMDNLSIDEIGRQLSKGALMGARGNSGVILSQILRGLAKGFEGSIEVDNNALALSFAEGTKAAYKAVMRPTEGTILTIVRVAGESALKSEKIGICELLKEICDESEIMLNKTPEMLPVLKKAKVVDAGGMGLLIMLKGMYEALTNNLIPKLSSDITEKIIYSPAANLDVDIVFGYCTEFFIRTNNPDTESLKLQLEPLGDSMIVVGVDDIIKVHIHTNDPGKILSYAVAQGELSKVKIDNMREQHRNLLELKGEQKEIIEPKIEDEEIKKYAFVSVAMGDGISNIFRDLGVDYVIEGGQTMNPSTQDILECIKKINAEHIFILPNNKNIIMAANQAVELSDKKITVIKTKTIPQGISAVTAFNMDSSLEDNINLMEKAISSVKSAAITYAVRETEIEDKVIEEGDILGLIEGKIVEVNKDIYINCQNLIKDMITETTELITIFYGQDALLENLEVTVKKLQIDYPDIDIQYYNGEQPLYYFIISVE